MNSELARHGFGPFRIRVHGSRFSPMHSAFRPVTWMSFSLFDHRHKRTMQPARHRQTVENTQGEDVEASRMLSKMTNAQRGPCIKAGQHGADVLARRGESIQQQKLSRSLRQVPTPTMVL